MNNKEYIKELFKIVPTDSILVVTNKKKLVRLNCPFMVKANRAFPDIKAGETVLVDKVKVNDKLKDIFIINDKAYLISYFQILL
jgi:hypothetical protein